MNASTINALMAEMDPDEIRLIPRFVDTWLRAGWMDESEAADWQLGALAWRAEAQPAQGRALVAPIADAALVLPDHDLAGTHCSSSWRRYEISFS